MARRPYTVTQRCAYDDCDQRAHFEYDTRREEREARQRFARRPWLCVRHTRPDEVLAADNVEREQVLIVVEETYGQFWEDAEGTRLSGFQHGPGFKAYAKDFPPGTRLTVTARVEVP